MRARASADTTRTAPLQPRTVAPRLDSFIGRERELRALEQLLHRNQLVTVVGPPGAGKTRLAAELALRLSSAQAGTAWLLDFAPLDSDDEMPPVVASNDGCEVQAVLDVLRGPLAAGMKVLVLDTCETRIETSSELARQLLDECPHLTLLATSREPLRIEGACAYRIGGLSLSTARAEAQCDYVGSDAVRLFIERARESSAQFDPTTDAVTHISEICSRLDGLPLAIELTARRSNLLPLSELLGLLGGQSRFFTEATRTADPRHRGLEDAVAWSYRLLSSMEQAVIRRLAVAPGGLPRSAVGVVCWNGDVPWEALPNTISTLEAKSLVVAAEDRRVAQLEMIRLAARQWLVSEGESESASRRLADWLRGIADPADPSVVVTEEDHDRLAAERENLLYAVGWAADLGDPRHALFAAALAECNEQPDELAGDLERLTRALRRTERDSPYRGRLLVQAARISGRLDDRDRSLAYADEAVAVERLLGCPTGLPRALSMRGSVHFLRGEFRVARTDFQRYLALVRELGQPWAVMDGLCKAAWAALHTGDLDAAEELISRHRWARRGGPAPQGMCLVEATLALDRDDLAAAEMHLRAAATASRSARTLLPRTLESMALIMHRKHQADLALRLGAVGNHLRVLWHLPSELGWRRKIDDAMAQARSALPPDAGADAWEAGTRLSPDGAVALALGTEAASDSGSAELLTCRQRSVGMMLADGLTNQQIARRLGVAARTVESEITFLRATFGTQTRAQLAVRVADHLGHADAAAFRFLPPSVPSG